MNQVIADSYSASLFLWVVLFGFTGWFRPPFSCQLYPPTDRKPYNVR